MKQAPNDYKDPLKFAKILFTDLNHCLKSYMAELQIKS